MEILTRMLRTATRFRSRTTPAVLAALSIALAPGVATLADESDQSLEYAVKAAVLYKFSFFVEWPAAAFVSPTSPFRLCIVGEDPFGSTLDKAVNGQKVGTRPIEVRRLKTAGQDSGCQILYIGVSEAPRLGQIIETLRGSSVLTVSDGRAPGTAAGIIHFVIKDDRVRFDINDEAAAQNGLVISSKLMSLALNVKRTPPKEPVK